MHGTNLCRQIDNEKEKVDYKVSGNKIYFGAHLETNVKLELNKFKTKLNSLKTFADLSYINLFDIMLGLKLVDDVLNNIAQFEHISPIFNRFQKRKKRVVKSIRIQGR
ncbi:hypothetical protein DCS65_20180 [Bacillus subtilis]|nr:hypothetical protein DCS65_20180 [Bacillus subtilis]